MIKPVICLSLAVVSTLHGYTTEQYPIQNIKPIIDEDVTETENANIITSDVYVAGFDENFVINYKNNINENEVKTDTEITTTAINKTYYTTTNLNFRSKDSIKSSVIRVLSYGESVYVISEKSNGWSKVKCDDKVGYVKSEYLTDTAINYLDYSLSKYGYDSSFKSYMPYTAITSKSSKQWKLQQKAVTNSNGLRTVNGRACVAIGTYFNAEVGTKIDLIMENGATIQAIVADIKDNKHTDSRNIQTFDGSCVEVLVRIASLPSMVRKMGNVSYVSDDWQGNIKKIRVYK